VEHIRAALMEGRADAALIASMAHIDGRSPGAMKAELRGMGVAMRK
jgi:imidazole glycerol phosphate synthase subunit HisF